PELGGRPLPPIGSNEPPKVQAIKHLKPEEETASGGMKVRPVSPTAPATSETRTLGNLPPPPSFHEGTTSSGKPIERSSFTPTTATMGSGAPATGSEAPEAPPSGGARLGAPRVGVRIVDDGIAPVAAKEPAVPPGKLDTSSLRPVESEAPSSFRVETVSA